MTDMTILANRCIHRDNDGICIKTLSSCPARIRVDINNKNNMPCDGVSYNEVVGR